MAELVIGWKALLAIVGGSGVLTTGAVWAVCRFAMDRFKTLIDSYAGESAKLLAQFHNLDKLIVQTEKLTATAETIKGQIADGIWDRQKKWEAKRDFYVKTLEAMADWKLSIMRLRRAVQDHEAGKGLPDHPAVKNYLEEAMGRLKSTEADHDAHFATLNRICSVAPIYCSEEGIRILTGTLGQCCDGPVSQEQAIRISTALNDGAFDFADFAWKDLGFQDQSTVGITRRKAD